MTVHCEGDCRVIEQLGEKQDFESELSRLGFKHEDFVLYVGIVSSKAPGRVQEDYSVTVANVTTGQQRVYHGGPRHEWLKDCVRDLASGALGSASPGRV